MLAGTQGGCYGVFTPCLDPGPGADVWVSVRRGRVPGGAGWARGESGTRFRVPRNDVQRKDGTTGAGRLVIAALREAKNPCGETPAN
jgi:hypothetical protein